MRTLGYSLSYGDREEGIISVAVPIFNRRGELAFSLSIAGPAQRFTEEQAVNLVQQKQKMCRDVSTQI